MKKKYIAILLGVTVGMTALAGCSGTSTSESSTTQESQSVTGATERSEKMTGETEEADVYGEVRAVSDEGITIKVGTMKQMEKPDDAGNAGETPNAQNSDDKSDSDNTEKKANQKMQTAVKINQTITLTSGMHSLRQIWKNQTETDRACHPCWI